MENAACVTSSELNELAQLRAENARLKFREKTCETENQAMLISLVRFMQEVAEELGLGEEHSPAEILDELKAALKCPSSAAEVRQFIGSNFSAFIPKNIEGEPSGYDMYHVTAHDIASSFADLRL